MTVAGAFYGLVFTPVKRGVKLAKIPAVGYNGEAKAAKNPLGRNGTPATSGFFYASVLLVEALRNNNWRNKASMVPSGSALDSASTKDFAWVS